MLPWDGFSPSTSFSSVNIIVPVLHILLTYVNLLEKTENLKKCIAFWNIE